jgi:hypothetical protein
MAVKTINGLAVASVKTAIGAAIATVKTWLGVATIVAEDIGLATATPVGTNAQAWAFDGMQYVAIKINVGAHSTITKGKISVNSAGAGNWHQEVWSDGGASPSAQIGVDSQTLAVTNGLNSVDYLTPVPVTPGSDVWLVCFHETTGQSNTLNTVGTGAGYVTGGSGTAPTNITSGNLVDASEDLMIGAVCL